MQTIEIQRDPESEFIALSLMARYPEALHAFMDALTASHFFEGNNSIIFGAFQTLFREGKEITLYAVRQILKEIPNFDFDYLMQIETCYAGSLYDIENLIGSLVIAYRKRTLVNILRNNLIAAGAKETAFEAISQTVCDQIETIKADYVNNSVKTLEEIADASFFGTGLNFEQFVDRQRELFKAGKSTLRGLPTHFANLDSKISGLCRGHFIVVAARTGVGKTTFCLNVMKKMAAAGTKVGFVSLEMCDDEIVAKLACMDSNLSFRDVTEGRINDFQNMELKGSIYEIKKLPLFIDAEGALTIDKIISRVKRLVSIQGIEVLFIDYLGLINHDKEFKMNQEKFSDISKKLKQLAMKLQIPIVCICQLNRQGDHDDPSSSNLRDSGQIEQDAHTIMMLVKIEDDYCAPYWALMIKKNRFGPECVVKLDFNGATGRMREI